MQQILLEAISKDMRSKKMTRNSPHGFTKCKSWLNNSIAFYEMTGFVDKWRGINVTFHFSKAFDTTYFSTLVAKLVRYILGK